MGHLEQDSAQVDHNMVLRARFVAIPWLRPGICSPPGGGTLAESGEDRDQGTCLASAGRSSSIWSTLRHTPASCQSHKFHQQVVPLPQLIS